MYPKFNKSCGTKNVLMIVAGIYYVFNKKIINIK